jgi:hypothetical protein
MPAHDPSFPRRRESIVMQKLYLLARTWIPACAGMTLLAVVFLAYTRPDFVVNMSNQIWFCFS